VSIPVTIAESLFTRGRRQLQQVESLVAAAGIAAVTMFLGLLLLHGRFPAHDTRADYECFHIFYNSLLQYHELPLWFSGMQYGVPADLDLLIHLSTAQFLAAGVGWLLHVRNTLALFYAAGQIEVFVLGFGGFLLGRSLFRRLAPTVLLVTSLLFSTFYLWQIYWDFRIFVWMPLALYFFHRFARMQEPRSLLAVGVCLVVGMIGQNPYIGLPFVLVVALLSVGLLWETGVFDAPVEFLQALWRALRHDWLAAGLLMAACVILAGAWLSIGLHALDYVQLAAPDREANGRVGLDKFLGYGFNAGFGKLLELLFATPSNMDARFFTGYLNLVFFFFAVIWARRKMVLVLVAATGLLVLLSVGEATMMPALLYYLVPGADRFRHIGLLLPIARCMMFLVAAFGLEEALDRAGTAPAGTERSLLAITGSLLALAVALGVRFGHDLPYLPVWKTSYADTREVWILSLLAALTLLVLLIRARIHQGTRLEWLGTVAIAAACFELGSNQYMLHRGAELFPAGVEAATLARPLRAGLWREDDMDPALDSAHQALARSPGMQYGTVDTFLGVNLCQPEGRADIRNQWLAGLWNLVNRVVPGQPPANRILVSDPRAFPVSDVLVSDPDLRDAFSRSLLGCPEDGSEGRPTLFLTRNVRLAGSESQSRAAMVEIAGQHVSAYPKPRMTIQSSSVEPGGTYGAAGLLTGANAWYASSPPRYPQTLTLHLDVPAAVDGLELLPELPLHEPHPRFVPPDSAGEPAPDLAARAPAAFSFQGSMNGRDWAVLLSATGTAPAPDPPADPEGPLWRSWRFPNTTPYRLYRLTITANGGDPHYLSLQSLRLLVQGGGQGLAATVIETTPENGPGSTDDPGGNAGDPVSITGVSYNSLQVTAKADSAGWLVRREGWHPGWQVWVDGQPRPLVRADLGFQAVWLKPGNHQLVFRFTGNQGFAAKYWTIILLSSLLFLSLVALVLAGQPRRTLGQSPHRHPV
jgi:hypothetical protein